jgi:diguanylate cyclase (GGDEF)-like protein
VLSFGTVRLGVFAANLPAPPAEADERLLRSVAAQLSLFLHNTMERGKVHEMATHDGLTGLSNFRSFREIFGREFERFLRYGRNLSLMMIDLDNFKGVNDTFGHQVGDKVLSMVAGIIQNSLRKTDYGFRYGGDEFVVLLPDRDAWQAEILARRIHAAVKKQVRGVPPLRFSLSVSIGIADCGSIASREGDELLKRTDGALYKAKEGGRDRIEVAEPVAPPAADAGKRDALV